VLPDHTHARQVSCTSLLLSCHKAAVQLICAGCCECWFEAVVLLLWAGMASAASKTHPPCLSL
jgi:hypothetical protein